MQRLIKIHLVFLGVSLIIAFLLVPADMLYLNKVQSGEVKAYYQSAKNLEFSDAWKIAFTWFLGLTCGRLILKALFRK